MSEVMLHGVLCMPPELWDNTEIDKQQRYSRYLQASDLIKDVERENEQLRAELAAAQKRIAELEGRTCVMCNHSQQYDGKDYIYCMMFHSHYHLPHGCSVFEPKKED